jgi:glycosyltransferase involved in cell wall biosynthesis
VQNKFLGTSKKSLLWFGNHGSKNIDFGMLDLLLIQDDIEALSKQFDIKLVVISNNREKFDLHISKFDMCTEYYDWSEGVVEQQLKKAFVVLLPNPLNNFTKCKSANRALLSLAKGVPVVATRTQALDVFTGAINFDNFYKGIYDYIANPSQVKKHISLGKKIISKKFNHDALIKQWAEVFNSIKKDSKLN